MPSIKHKYALNDYVYWMQVSYPTNVRVTCPKCNGAGKLKLEGLNESVECPQCHGWKQAWVATTEPEVKIEGPLLIGKVTVESYSELCWVGTRYQGSHEIRYMVDKYGVGSGQLFREEELFHTIKAAKLAAKRIIAEKKRNETRY